LALPLIPLASLVRSPQLVLVSPEQLGIIAANAGTAGSSHLEAQVLEATDRQAPMSAAVTLPTAHDADTE
jgi:hypothetical protein